MKNDNLDHENRPVKYGITPDELRQIQQRRIEAHAARVHRLHPLPHLRRRLLHLERLRLELARAAARRL